MVEELQTTDIKLSNSRTERRREICPFHHFAFTLTQCNLVDYAGESIHLRKTKSGIGKECHANGPT